jgi:DNA-binding NarL/FixJ family response regulator
VKNSDRHPLSLALLKAFNVVWKETSTLSLVELKAAVKNACDFLDERHRKIKIAQDAAKNSGRSGRPRRYIDMDLIHRLKSDGKHNREIAEQLGVSENTIASRLREHSASAFS